jgi:hypothetical protein
MASTQLPDVHDINHPWPTKMPMVWAGFIVSAAGVAEILSTQPDAGFEVVLMLNPLYLVPAKVPAPEKQRSS